VSKVVAIYPSSQIRLPNDPEVIPFLKWPGGKRWFVYYHANVLPRSYKRYIEPFLGAGSVFFYLRPDKAILGDINDDLVNAYRVVKSDCGALERELKKYDENHGYRHYYRIRDYAPRTALNRAARFIYLNRTCFNGIFRVNLEGKFNVPKGTKNAVLYETDNFVELARSLTNTELQACDFEVLVDRAAKGDFVFVDPPYTVRHNVNGFLKYNEKLFSWSDQERLSKALARARKRGAEIVGTNANHKSVRDLYRKLGFRLSVISRFSRISADVESRRQFDELLIRG
jgi:DNA adenine methylase